MCCNSTRIIFDCDTGIDDSFALLYLLAQPNVELAGICSTAGNVPVDVVTRNNLAWLDLMHHSEIPVSVGAAAPLNCELRTTEDTHGDYGIGYAQLPNPTSTPSGSTAANMWISLTRSHPRELVGLVTGPLTNLALAIQTDPDLPKRLRRLVIMGGSFHHPGNTTPAAEWNTSVDPEAANIVCAAFETTPGAPRPIWCGLNLTERIELHPHHLTQLDELVTDAPSTQHAPHGCADTTNSAVQALKDASRFYFEFHREHNQGYLAHMHDPFAAAVAINPTIVTTKLATVDVELQGTLTRGMTVADYSRMWGRPINAHIATDTDPARFLDDLIRSLARSCRSLQP